MLTRIFILFNQRSLILNKAKDTVKKLWYVFQIKKKAVLTLIAVADTLTKRQTMRNVAFTLEIYVTIHCNYVQQNASIT